LAGTATLHEGVLSVENADLLLDGNNGSGALELAFGKRPAIVGTLAFARLDLTPYFSGLSRALRTAENWRAISLSTDWFRDFTADLRISADHVRIEGLEAGPTAATLSLRDRRLELGLARAELGGGGVAGDLAVTDSDKSGAAYEAQFRASELNLEEVAPISGLRSGMRGVAAVSLDAAATGGTLGALLEAAAGTASLEIRKGAVPLFGIAEIATSAPPVSPSAPLTVIPITSLSASAGLAGNGGADIERFALVAPAFTAEATGRVEFSGGDLRLEGTVYPGGSEGAGGGEPLPFRLEGTLRRPVAVPLALAN
jgi:uncharacterized protein involved in outer membrane biogenesis